MHVSSKSSRHGDDEEARKVEASKPWPIASYLLLTTLTVFAGSVRNAICHQLELVVDNRAVVPGTLLNEIPDKLSRLTFILL